MGSELTDSADSWHQEVLLAKSCTSSLKRGRLLLNIEEGLFPYQENELRTSLVFGMQASSLPSGKAAATLSLETSEHKQEILPNPACTDTAALILPVWQLRTLR